MSKEQWYKGYKETKNVIHNDIGVTKEEILEVFHQVAKEEIQKIVSDSGTFVYQSIREVIQSEMIDAVDGHRYPKVNGNMLFYSRNGRGENSFKDYVAGVMKEEILRKMNEQFTVKIDIGEVE